MRAHFALALAALLALTSACARDAFAPAPRAAARTFVSIPAGDQAPRRALFPSTPSGVHLELVFNYAVADVRNEIGHVDVVWGANAPRPRGIFNQSYTTFQREDAYGPHPTHSVAWWKTHHPDWIEYTCRRKIAFGFGEPNMPLDIANPAVWQYQRTSAVGPALRAGYQGIAFDNVDLDNDDGRCGHYALDGAWVAQYTGNYADPAYARDVLSWARSTYAYVHAFSPTATMAINDSYQFDASRAENLALMRDTDMVLDERGFTNWGAKPNVSSTHQWSVIAATIARLQAGGTCYMENGEEPGLSSKIAQAERLWVVGNYLLTRDRCTYMWISGFTASGAQDYGRILLYPEYRLPIGTPLAPRAAVGAGWERRYSGGIVLVNPSSKAVAFPLAGSYTDENGTPYSGSVTLASKSAQILLASSP